MTRLSTACPVGEVPQQRQDERYVQEIEDQVYDSWQQPETD